MTEADVRDVMLGYFHEAWVPGKDLDRYVALCVWVHGGCRHAWPVVAVRRRYKSSER